MNAALFERKSDPATPDADESGARPPSRLTLDDVYGLLANRRRRIVVEYLQETPETNVAALADHVTAVENGRSDGSFTPEERKRVYVSLYQTHLPKLADSGVIRYDRDENAVAVGPTMGQVVAVLRPWQEEPESGGLAGLLARLLPLGRA